MNTTTSVTETSELKRMSPDLSLNKGKIDELEKTSEELQFTVIKEGHHVSLSFKNNKAVIDSTNIKSASRIIGKGMNTLNKFIEYCKIMDINLELNGIIDEKEDIIIWTDIYDLDQRLDLVTGDRINLYQVCQKIHTFAAPIAAKSIASYDKIIGFAIEYFKEHDVRGLNVRTYNNKKLNININNPKA